MFYVTRLIRTRHWKRYQSRRNKILSFLTDFVRYKNLEIFEIVNLCSFRFKKLLIFSVKIQNSNTSFTHFSVNHVQGFRRGLRGLEPKGFIRSKTNIYSLLIFNK